jgi:putative hemolysin
MKKLLLSLMIGVVGYAQNPQTISMSGPPPSAPTNVSVQVVNGDNSTYYYWVVANYPNGKVVTANSTPAFRAPATFSGSKYVNIGWSTVTGATSYDVLRTTTQSPPIGTNNSSVATALTVGSFQDTVVSPSSYTLNNLIPTFNGAISIDNTNFPITELLWSLPPVNIFPLIFESFIPRTIGSGVNQLPSATPANLNYIALVNDASAFCAATGGGTSQSLLISNGSAWVSVCGSGGGGTKAFYQNYPSALCVGGVAGYGFSTPAANAPTAACQNSGTTVLGVLQFSAAATQSIQHHFELPPDWTGAIDLEIASRSNDSTHAASVAIQTACVGAAAVDNPTFNGAQTVNITNAAAAARTLTTQNALTTTGCSAGDEFFFKIAATTTAFTDTFDLITLRFTVRRTF